MHTSIPAAGTGLFPGTGLHMLWDTDLTVRRIWMEISVPRLPLVQVEDFVSSLFATIVCSPGSHHHSLVCTGFSSCILIGKADWCTEGMDRIYFFISSFFLLVLEESTRHVFASSDFWALHPFHTGAWTRGRTGHLVVAWVDEYLSHGLRAKPEPCYGKVNKWCYLIVPPESFRELFLRDLRANQLLTWKHRAFTWNFPLPRLAASLPCCDCVTLWVGTLCTSPVSSSQDPAGNVETSLAVPCISASWGM